MKVLNIFILGMLAVVFTTTISATDVNGRFVVTGTNNGTLELRLQINTSTGSDDLGGATIVLEYDNSSLRFPNIPIKYQDYIFHNFCGGTYSPATITKPSNNKIWINIDLPYNNSNNGTIVSGTGGWTDVATLFFNITVPGDTLKVDWLEFNPYWGIYDGNNSTLWTPGNFENLVYIYNNNCVPRILSAALQNHSNIVLVISEPVDSIAALNINNYTLSNGMSVNSININSNKNKITLSTSQHIQGQNYTVTVNNITDNAGNIISPSGNSFNYVHSDPVSNLQNLDVYRAYSNSCLSGYTPDKMIDGITIGDSRWNGAKQMPDTIVFRLNDSHFLNALRISFFDWSLARIYNYSVFVSTDSVSWNQVINNIPSQPREWSVEEVEAIEAKYIKVILLSSNYNLYAGIWEAEFWGRLKVAGNQNEEETLPIEFSLEQNYPNPFNPSTKIIWQSPVSSHQTIKIYDILGNEVATLINEFKEAGKYEINFDAKDLASGVYIYRLNADAFTETRKMVLLR